MECGGIQPVSFVTYPCEGEQRVDWPIFFAHVREEHE